jgi:signal transduction histidine kinase
MRRNLALVCLLIIVLAACGSSGHSGARVAVTTSTTNPQTTEQRRETGLRTALTTAAARALMVYARTRDYRDATPKALGRLDAKLNFARDGAFGVIGVSGTRGAITFVTQGIDNKWYCAVHHGGLNGKTSFGKAANERAACAAARAA